MLDPENDTQTADPPETTGGVPTSSRTSDSDTEIEVDSTTARKPADPPETVGGGG